MHIWGKIPRNYAAVLVVLAALAISGACGDGPTGPETGSPDPVTGSLDVGTITTGANLDPDGYTIMVDRELGPTIGINATEAITELPEGEHEVELLGVSANCFVAVSNPQAVSIEAGETAEVSFRVSCLAASGSLLITTATSTAGSALDLDPDGYEMWIEGQRRLAVAIDATLTLTNVGPGDHQIELLDVDSNCSVAGANPRSLTVEEGTESEIRFDVECAFVLREIVFVSNGDVVVMASDGASPRTLAKAGSAASGGGWTTPDWSPDGSRIVLGPELWCWFNCDIEVLDVEDGQGTRLTSAGTFDQPVWSSDGTRVAFVGWGEGNDEIYVMDANGTNVVRLTRNSIGDGNPAWSPDGSKIAFTSNRDGNLEIYVMNADGTDPVRLTFDPEADSSPDWSPDGSKIAFASSRDGDYEVYVMDADGSNLVRLTFAGGWDDFPAWSSDGSRIAFTRVGDIWVMDADGTNQNALTDDRAFEAWPDWLP